MLDKMSKSSIGKISSYQVNILVFIQTVDKTFGCEHGWMWKFICLVPVPVQVLAELKKTVFFKYWSSAALFNLVTIHRMHEVTRELNVVTDSCSEMNFYFFNFFWQKCQQRETPMNSTTIVLKFFLSVYSTLAWHLILDYLHLCDVIHGQPLTQD
jgi:hypothetical protein